MVMVMMAISFSMGRHSLAARRSQKKVIKPKEKTPTTQFLLHKVKLYHFAALHRVATKTPTAVL